MPIVHRNTPSDGTFSLAVWESTEPLDELLACTPLDEREILYFQSLRSESRKREFLTVRHLLSMLCGSNEGIVYNEFGKPALKSGGFISITHSKAHIGLIVSNGNAVGIDLEALRPQITTLAPKFISNRELTLFGTSLDEHTMHLIWGAKEVLFKLYGKGELDFKKDMEVAPSSTVHLHPIKATLRKNDCIIHAAIHHTVMNGFMLVWTALKND